jgi:hypothetical protein
MADATNTQIVYDEAGYVVAHITNLSDGTGGQVTFQPSTLQGAPAHVAIDRIVGSAALMGVQMLWDATSPLLFFALGANMWCDTKWRDPGNPGRGPQTSLINGAGAGKTGNILIKTVTAVANASYCLTIYARKTTA